VAARDLVDPVDDFLPVEPVGIVVAWQSFGLLKPNEVKATMTLAVDGKKR
jgi:hypothetical protein